MPKLLTRSLLCASLFIVFTLITAASAAETTLPLSSPSGGWPHNGVFGKFDRGALRRGFQVYKMICASCHSMRLLSYRNLAQIGFNDEEVRTIATGAKVTDGPDDRGEMFKRPGRPSDTFALPFPNDQVARLANGGALPPDLSLIIKAHSGHEDYVYSILTGYKPPPANEQVAEGMYYNPYFPGHQIEMPPPLTDNTIAYADGTPATVEQMSKDVVQFLTWAAEPNLEVRHQIGFKVLLFLIVFAVVMYRVKQKIWKQLN